MKGEVYEKNSKTRTRLLQEIRSVNAQRTSVDGQLKSVKASVDFSTVSLSLNQVTSEQSQRKETKPQGPLAEAADKGLAALQKIIAFVLLVSIVLSPGFLAGGILYLFRRKRKL